MKYLLGGGGGGVSFSILVHGFSWLYCLSGGGGGEGDRASRNSKWSYQYTNVLLPKNFNCTYIHHCRNGILAFPSPFSSMDS